MNHLILLHRALLQSSLANVHMMHHHEHLQHRVRQTMIQEVLQLVSQVRHHRRGAAADLLQRGLRVHVCRRTHQRRVSDLAELGRHEVRRMALSLIHASQSLPRPRCSCSSIPSPASARTGPRSPSKQSRCRTEGHRTPGCQQQS